MNLNKEFVDNNIQLPKNGECVTIALTDSSKIKFFDLDLDRRGKIELKNKLQNRYNKSIVLVRLEINSQPHMNPDGRRVGRNHIHVYKEGFGDRWAYELDKYPQFIQCKYFDEYFREFCKYCNIKIQPNIQTVI